MTVGKERLIEPVKSFGQAYHAIPDDDEFECEYAPQGPPSPGDIVAPGSDANAGRFLEADLEGLTVVTSVRGETLMLASSQGDSSFHFYLIGRGVRHLGSFLVDGVGDTDGVHYVPVPLGKQSRLDFWWCRTAKHLSRPIRASQRLRVRRLNSVPLRRFQGRAEDARKLAAPYASRSQQVNAV